MRTAVLVFGMLREFDSVMTRWRFDKHLDCDYYFSTWSKSKQKIDNFGPDTPENNREYVVTDELIKSICPNSVCDILDENEIFIRECKTTQSKMFFHWKNSYRLMLESGKKYDLVILIRPDVPLSIHSFGTSENDETDKPIDNWEYNENQLYSDKLMSLRPTGIQDNPFQYLYSDLFFCGSFKVMEKFMNAIPDMNLDIFKYKDWMPHIDLANFLFPVGLYPSDIHPFFVLYPDRPKKP